MTIQLPELNEGETYIATLFDAATQQGHHIILLAGDNDDAEWQAQMDWAKSIGGDLPSRVEQSLLFAKHKDLFQRNAYWSNEQHASGSDYAWCQIFGYGYQSYYDTFSKLRARAVRRLII